MKKFTLGVFFDTKLSIGGSFQQSFNNIFLSNKLISDEIEVKVITTIPENIKILKQHEIDCFLYSPNFLTKIWLNILDILPHKIYRAIIFFKKKIILKNF